jgi:hypothetical protein
MEAWCRKKHDEIMVLLIKLHMPDKQNNHSFMFFTGYFADRLGVPLGARNIA